MAVRKFKPTTPGQRHKIIGTFEEITARVPEKSLVFGKKSSGGRNNTGKMTMRYIGGGSKKIIRIVDFKRNKDGVPAVVKTIEYDPNRSARHTQKNWSVIRCWITGLIKKNNMINWQSMYAVILICLCCTK